MNCPQCCTEMVDAQATSLGETYKYCRACKKELAEIIMRNPEHEHTINLGTIKPDPARSKPAVPDNWGPLRPNPVALSTFLRHHYMGKDGKWYRFADNAPAPQHIVDDLSLDLGRHLDKYYLGQDGRWYHRNNAPAPSLASPSLNSHRPLDKYYLDKDGRWYHRDDAK